MKKRILATLLIMLFVLPHMVLAAEQERGVSVVVDGQTVSFAGQPPVLVGGSTLVPVRGVFERMGYEVGWDNATKTVSLKRGTSIIKATIDSPNLVVNGSPSLISPVPQIINGSTMLPLRAIASATGAAVDWDNNTKTITITTSPAPVSTVQNDPRKINLDRNYGTTSPEQLQRVLDFAVATMSSDRWLSLEEVLALNEVYGGSDDSYSGRTLPYKGRPDIVAIVNACGVTPPVDIIGKPVVNGNAIRCIDPSFGGYVCGDQARFVQIFLDIVGAENEYVVGTCGGIPHAWIKVKIDGEWWHFNQSGASPFTTNPFDAGLVPK